MKNSTLVEHSFTPLSLLQNTGNIYETNLMYYSTTKNIHQTLGLASKVGDPSVLIFYGTQCSMLSLGIKPSDLLFFQAYLVIFQPVIQVAIIFIFLLLAKLIWRAISLTKIMSVVIPYFIMSHQPGLVSFLAMFQSCTTLKGLGYVYIAAHPSWSCDSENYLFISKYIASPALVLWCVIFPIGILFGLLRYGKNNSTEKLKNIFGMMLTDVKNDYYYWGIVLMVFKLLLSLVSMSLRDKMELQIQGCRTCTLSLEKKCKFQCTSDHII